MYLYDKRKNQFDIYALRENREDAVAYRRQEMKQIPYEERVLIHRQKDLRFRLRQTPALEGDSSYFDETVIPMESITYNISPRIKGKLTQANITQRERDMLLKRFYRGNYTKNDIARIRDNLNRLRYLLLTERKYIDDINNSIIRRMPNIIEVPKSLFALQMFEQGKFGLLDSYDIIRTLELFQITKLDEISIDELRKMDRFHITENAFDEINQKADNQVKKVLSIAKGIGRL